MFLERSRGRVYAVIHITYYSDIVDKEYRDVIRVDITDHVKQLLERARRDEMNSIEYWLLRGRTCA